MNCGFRLLTDFWALVLGPRRFLGSHRVLGPGPSYGPESRFSGMPSAIASETLYKNIDKNLLVTFFFQNKSQPQICMAAWFGLFASNCTFQLRWTRTSRKSDSHLPKKLFRLLK